jgi:Nif-specific regulatory protein
VNQRNVNLTAGALARLQQYSWPGNIRELANFIERIVLLADRPFLDAADIERFLPQDDDCFSIAPSSTNYNAVSEPTDAWESGRQHSFSLAVRPYGRFSSHTSDLLMQTLEQCGGNKSRAAHMLGMTVRQFSYRWNKLGLSTS